jgi:GMP synthase (glutamine-hydrolysing)
MNIYVIDNGSIHLRALEHRLQYHNVVIRTYRNDHAALATSADLIILTGGHTSVLRHDHYFKRELELIRNSRVPIIGICLGHELIARAYGTRPKRLLRKVHGLELAKLHGDLTSRNGRSAVVYEAHIYAVKQVPPNFTRLATSSSGVEIMASESLRRYSMQFHPEVLQPPNDGLDLFEQLMSVATFDYHAQSAR